MFVYNHFMEYGTLTQLGECHLDVVKVVGSSPIRPTIPKEFAEIPFFIAHFWALSCLSWRTAPARILTGRLLLDHQIS